MVKQIIFWFIPFCFFIAVMVFTTSGLTHVELGQDFYQFMAKVSYDYNNWKLEIPYIPDIPSVQPINGFADVLNAIIGFLNGIVQLLNFIVLTINFIIKILQFMLTMVGDIFWLIGNLASQSLSVAVR